MTTTQPNCQATAVNPAEKDETGTNAKSAAPAIKLPDLDKLIISSSPHLHSGLSTRRIMLLVLLALLPACGVGVYMFGLPALRVLVLTTFSCVVLEVLFSRLMGRASSIGDASAVVTGVLLGMNLSSLTPWWVCVLGAVLAIGLGKQLYGGLGYNPFNPALVGRVGLLIAFPQLMTTWAKPMPGQFGIFSQLPDAITTATPLDIAKTSGISDAAIDYGAFFLGKMPGSIGETSALALLIGGIFLISLRLIRWQIPFAYLSSVALFTCFINRLLPEMTPPPLFHMLTGGLFLGAFFMATDMVTSPMSRKGAWIFGIGCGLVTSIIRIWGTYPEGVSFAILFMNAFVPIINRYTMNVPFGSQRKQESVPA